MDMSKPFSLSTISQTAQQMIKRGIPFRVGLVPLISESNDDLSGFGAVVVSKLCKAQSWLSTLQVSRWLDY